MAGPARELAERSAAMYVFEAVTKLEAARQQLLIEQKQKAAQDATD